MNRSQQLPAAVRSMRDELASFTPCLPNVTGRKFQEPLRPNSQARPTCQQTPHRQTVLQLPGSGGKVAPQHALLRIALVLRVHICREGCGKEGR